MRLNCIGIRIDGNRTGVRRVEDRRPDPNSRPYNPICEFFYTSSTPHETRHFPEIGRAVRRAGSASKGPNFRSPTSYGNFFLLLAASATRSMFLKSTICNIYVSPAGRASISRFSYPAPHMQKICYFQGRSHMPVKIPESASYVHHLDYK